MKYNNAITEAYHLILTANLPIMAAVLGLSSLHICSDFHNSEAPPLKRFKGFQ